MLIFFSIVFLRFIKFFFFIVGFWLVVFVVGVVLRILVFLLVGSFVEFSFVFVVERFEGYFGGRVV